MSEGSKNKRGIPKFEADNKGEGLRVFVAGGSRMGNDPVYAEEAYQLGRLIVKCHVKDFKLGPDGHSGEFVLPREGSIDWPVVRRTLDDVGYNGWLTAEGWPLDHTFADLNQRLDLIIAGK